MYIRVVVPFRNFHLENNTVIKINEFTLTNNIESKNKILQSQGFLKQFGAVSQQAILENYLFLYEGESTEIEVLKSCESFGEIASMITNYLSTFCNALWFIKDNGCFISSSYIELFELDDAGAISESDGNMVIQNNVYSDSSGEYTPTTFLLREIEEWMIYFDQILIYGSTIKDKHKPLIPVIEYKNGIIPNKSNYIPYDSDRIGRALMFLQLARSKSNTIMKTTFHIAVFESLFTSGSSEITHQVSERAALFIGGTSTQKKDNYLLLKEAYGIRSNFVHGNQVKGNRESYLKIAVPLDELTRKLFKKVMNEPAIFQSSENNQKEFNEYFYNLIFSDDTLSSNVDKTNTDLI